MPHLILGTAGHIDHGKSSLVKRLTGSDPDRLPEEKARGVTIELGFAHLSLKEQDTDYEIGIIDVPGHADFVNNMVAGVGALNIALFIIAADDGWMPQSEEHLHILSYLGISNIIIVLTKTDLCDDVPFAIEMLKDELQDTSISSAPIIPVSSHTGEGMDELKKILLEKVKKAPANLDMGKPRLPIDRIFSPKGTGTVVTGTLSGGSLTIGDTLILQPLGIHTKVRFIQNHSHSLETAQPGMRTALNVPDLPINTPGKLGAQRGHTLTLEPVGQASDTVDIRLNRISRAIPGIKPRPLKHMETVMLHHGSTRCRARVILHGRSHLDAGEECLAQLRLEEPTFFLTGDRVVLRDGSQQSTIAGGIVLNTQSKRQNFRSEERAGFLNSRAENPHELLPYLTSLIARDHYIKAESALENHPFSNEQTAAATRKLVNQGKLIKSGNLLIDTDWWNELLTQAEQQTLSWHSQQPDQPHMPLTELHSAISDLNEELFENLLASLKNKGFQINNQEKGISHPDHSLTLPDEIKAEAATILSTLEKAGLQPPNRADLINNPRLEQAIKFLIRTKQVIELEPKVVISTQALTLAISKVTSFLTDQNQATASELKQHLDTSRKVAMPLLELLDTMNITVRNENHRTLKSMD